MLEYDPVCLILSGFLQGIVMCDLIMSACSHLMIIYPFCSCFKGHKQHSAKLSFFNVSVH